MPQVLAKWRKSTRGDYGTVNHTRTFKLSETDQRMAVRNRTIYAIATACVVVLGLASRKYATMLPDMLGKYPGDALWALMVFTGYGVLLPATKTWKLAALAMVTAYAVEFSQLYQAAWINSIRATILGHLVLGSEFHWQDLVAYPMGVALGVVFDVFGSVESGARKGNRPPSL